MTSRSKTLFFCLCWNQDWKLGSIHYDVHTLGKDLPSIWPIQTTDTGDSLNRGLLSLPTTERVSYHCWNLFVRRCEVFAMHACEGVVIIGTKKGFLLQNSSWCISSFKFQTSHLSFRRWSDTTVRKYSITNSFHLFVYLWLLHYFGVVM